MEDNPIDEPTRVVSPTRERKLLGIMERLIIFSHMSGNRCCYNQNGLVAIPPMSMAHVKNIYIIVGLNYRERPTRPLFTHPQRLIVSFSLWGMFPIDGGHTDGTGTRFRG